ncbi:MAG: hypothetical protein MJA29_13650, partial [Candidatus Omnitrophica bacterium]|nr:hypothetical protein [Candidatus Omnitrophota bacterium]
MRIREELKETDAVRHERRFCLHLWAACFVFVLLAGGACGSVYAETFEVTNDLWVNANLSVGTTVPSASLTIQGAGSDSGFSLRIADSEATDRLVVQDNGNLGIGTTSPLEAVHLTAGSLRQDSAVAPVVVGSLQNDTAFNAPEYVYVSGKYAYVTSDEGDRLNIVDVSSPENPVLISSLYNTTHLGDASGVMVAGKYAYIACQSGNRLTVVDVSNASNPQIAGSLYNDTLFTDIERLYVSGRYAYLAQGDYFTVVDVSDVNNPRITGVLNNSTLLGTTYAIYVSGRYAYVGTYYGNSLVVVDVSNASNPEIAGYVEGIAINPRSVCVNGRYAYVTLSDDRLEIVDVSDPGSPLSVGTLTN